MSVNPNLKESIMSIVSTHHTIVLHTPKMKAFAGQELLKIIAKATTSKDAAGKEVKSYSTNLSETKAVSIPRLSDDEIINSIPSIMGAVRNLFTEARKDIVRDAIINGATSIDEATITAAACVEHINTSGASEKLTTETVREWFAEYYSEHAAAYALRIMRIVAIETPEQQAKSDQYVNIVSGLLCAVGTAKRVDSIPERQARDVVKFANFAGDMDSVMSGIVARAKTVIAAFDKEEAKYALPDVE